MDYNTYQQYTENYLYSHPNNSRLNSQHESSLSHITQPPQDISSQQNISVQNVPVQNIPVQTNPHLQTNLPLQPNTLTLENMSTPQRRNALPPNVSSQPLSLNLLRSNRTNFNRRDSNGNGNSQNSFSQPPPNFNQSNLHTQSGYMNNPRSSHYPNAPLPGNQYPFQQSGGNNYPLAEFNHNTQGYQNQSSGYQNQSSGYLNQSSGYQNQSSNYQNPTLAPSSSYYYEQNMQHPDMHQNFNDGDTDRKYSGELQRSYDLTLHLPKEPPKIKSDDELWLETWLAKIGKININLESTTKIKRDSTTDSTTTDKRGTTDKHSTPVKSSSPRKNPIEIHNAKASLKKCLILIEKLQTTQEYLNKNVETIPSAEWKKKTVEIGLLKDEFSSVMTQFDNTENIKFLQKALEKRKKKRLKQQRKRLEQKEVTFQNKQERIRLNKEIDNWLENMKDAVERAKVEENMKKDADCVLAEVTKKKSDARKQLSVINALIKLRTVRENVASQRGEKTSLEDQAVFEKISEKLTTMWENSLKSYGKEEQGLRMMLEQNAAEDTISARVAKEKKITQEWELVFFGPKCIPSPAYWGLTSAERDVETFMAIRKSWDTFLSKTGEDGSTIPIGWVLPHASASENWTKFLQQ